MANSTILEGYLGSAPELRFSEDSYPTWSCRFRFPGQGKRASETNEVELVVYGKKALALSEDKALIKGVSVLISKGRIEHHKNEDGIEYPLLVAEDLRPWGQSASKLENIEDELVTLPVAKTPLPQNSVEEDAINYDLIPF